MSKLMMILGILAAAAGVALGLMAFFPASNTTLQVYGLSMQSAVTLIVGGLGLLGLGGVIAASEQTARAVRDLRTWLAGHEGSLAPHHHEAAAEAKAPAPAMAEKVVPAAAAAAGVAAVAEKTVETAKVTTADTIAALEKAKADISEALGGKLDAETEKDEPAVEDVEEVAAEEPGEEEDSDLYVTEEKTIRGRPARILSDGTVEAETDEGWMRFENLEHLEEYLDAVAPQPLRKA